MQLASCHQRFFICWCNHRYRSVDFKFYVCYCRAKYVFYKLLFVPVLGIFLGIYASLLLLFFASLLLHCSASLLFPASAFMLLCFSASPLFCFSAVCFFAFLLFPASLLLCFFASLLLHCSLLCFFLLCCFLNLNNPHETQYKYTLNIPKPTLNKPLNNLKKNKTTLISKP